MARSLLSATAQRIAERLDRAFTGVALVPRRRGAEDHTQRLRALEYVASFYEQPAHFEPGSSFFQRPAPIEPVQQRLRSFGRDGEVLDLRWPSTFEPLWSDPAAAALLSQAPPPIEPLPDPNAPSSSPIPGLDTRRSLREKYLDVRANRTAVARWFRHRSGARPCAVLLHGYMGGALALEERMFPVRKLFAGGMDVVLLALPFHGPRRDERRGLRPPAFPSNDPRFTTEGFRQIVFDHTALLDYLERRGAPAFGVMGTSLGGYASALLLTLERRLDFAVLFIPLGSLEQFYSDHGTLPGDLEQQQSLIAMLRRAHRVVSPCARPSLLPTDRLLVIAGELDRVTGLSHSRLLASHFGVEVITFSGGHVLQLGRTQALEPAFDLLARTGLYTDPWKAA